MRSRSAPGRGHGTRRSESRLLRAIWLIVIFVMTSGILEARPIELWGRVVDAQGRPFPGASVELVSGPDPWELARRHSSSVRDGTTVTTSTDHEGEYEIVAPGSGMWRLSIRHPEHLSVVYELRPLLTGRGLPQAKLLKRAIRPVRLLDVDGLPCADLPLTTRSWSSEGSRNGWKLQAELAQAFDDGVTRAASHAGHQLMIAAVSDSHYALEALPWSERQVDVHVAEPLVVAGLVDADGDPAPGILVGVKWPIDFHLGVSKKDGTILIPESRELLPHLVFVDESGRYPGQPVIERHGDEVVVRLPDVGMLDGRVLKASDGTELADALVWTSYGSLRSDSTGSFRLRLPKGRAAGFEVAAPGYLTEFIEVVNIAEEPEYRVVLREAGSLRGRTTDISGQEIAGVWVRAIPGPDGRGRPTNFRTLEALSNSEGRFRIDGLTPDTSYWLEARGRGFSPVAVEIASIEPGELEGIRLELEAGIHATGQVVDMDGHPVAGAQVTLVRTSPDAGEDVQSRLGSHRHLTTTDASGRFHLRDLASGVYRQRVRASGFSPVTIPGIGIAADAGVANLRTVRLETGVTVRGRVTDRDGEPLNGVLVSATTRLGPHSGQSTGDSIAARTAPDGFFRLEAVALSGVEITANLEGYRSRSLHDPSPDSDEILHIVLDRDIVLTGQVTDARGEPASGAIVQVAPSHPGGRRHAGHGFSVGSDGRFEEHGLRPGTVTLQAFTETAISELVELTIDEERWHYQVRLMLNPTATLEGHVVSADGAAVADAGVHVELDEGAPVLLEKASESASTDSAGNFLLRHLEAGLYVVRVAHPEFESVSESVYVKPNGVTDLELRLTDRLSHPAVSGQLVGSDGEVVGGAEVHLLYGGGRQQGASAKRTASAADGTFEMSAPGPGIYHLAVIDSRYALYLSGPFRVSRQMASGNVLSLDHGSVVTGKIRGLDPGAADRLVVFVRILGPIWREAAISHDGRFRVYGIPEGEWTLQAWLPRERSISERVDVGSPGSIVERDLTFPAGFRVEGLVRLDGRPRAGVKVEVECDRPRTTAWTTSRSEGGFEISGIPASECSLTLIDHESGVRDSRVLRIEGDTAAVFDLVRDSGHS